MAAGSTHPQEHPQTLMSASLSGGLAGYWQGCQVITCNRWLSHILYFPYRAAIYPPALTWTYDSFPWEDLFQQFSSISGHLQSFLISTERDWILSVSSPWHPHSCLPQFTEVQSVTQYSIFLNTSCPEQARYHSFQKIKHKKKKKIVN
jgi:hypothetical protein